MRNILIALLFCSLFSGDALAKKKKDPPFPPNLVFEGSEAFYGCEMKNIKAEPGVMPGILVFVWIKHNCKLTGCNPAHPDEKLVRRLPTIVPTTQEGLLGKIIPRNPDKANDEAMDLCKEWQREVRRVLREKIKAANGGKKP